MSRADSSRGAFIEELAENNKMNNVRQSFSPASQVFSPNKLLLDKGINIKEGMLV